MMTNKRLSILSDCDNSKTVKTNSSQIDWDKIWTDNNQSLFGNFFIQETLSYTSAHPNLLIGLNELNNIITPSYSLTSRKFNLWKKLELHLDAPIHEVLNAIDNPTAIKLMDEFTLSKAGICPPNYYFQNQAWMNVGSKYERSHSFIAKLSFNTTDYSTNYLRILACLEFWDDNVRFSIKNIQQNFINYSTQLERAIHSLEIIRLILKQLKSPIFLPKLSKNRKFDFSNAQAIEKFNLNSKYCELCWQPTIRSQEINKYTQNETNDQTSLMKSISFSNRYCYDHNPADKKSRYRKDLRYKSAFLNEVSASMTSSKSYQSNFLTSLNPNYPCINYTYGDEEDRRKVAYELVHSRLLLKPAKFKRIPKGKMVSHPYALTKKTLAAKVLELLSEGLTQSEIAEKLGKSRQEISRANKKLKELQLIHNLPHNSISFKVGQS